MFECFGAFGKIEPEGLYTFLKFSIRPVLSSFKCPNITDAID